MSIKYDSDGYSAKAKTPILASIFNAVGWLVVLATALLVVAAFTREEKVMSVPTVLIVSGSGGFVALIFFGIAQVLESIAKIEYHACREKNEAMLHSLHKIEGHLEALREKKKEPNQSLQPTGASARG